MGERIYSAMQSMREMIALIYTLGYFGFLVLVMFHDLPGSGAEVMKILLGVMSTAQIAIIQFYFGASQAEKNGGPNGIPKPAAPVTPAP